MKDYISHRRFNSMYDPYVFAMSLGNISRMRLVESPI